MEAIERYLHLAKHTTAVAFAKQEPGAFLLKRPAKTGEVSMPVGQIPFVTQPQHDRWTKVQLVP